MKLIISLLLINLTLAGISQITNDKIITTDIDNFWEAYDKITRTKDTNLQNEYITKLYIEKGTIGLKNIMKARRYTYKSYLDAINNYPLFWNSVSRKYA